MKVTIPALGLDLLSRSSMTSVSTDGIAVEERLREAHLVPAQIGDRGSQRGVADRDPDHEPEREGTVDDSLSVSVFSRQYSSSRCNSAGLCVMAVNQTLSVSVIVRRIGC